MTFQHGQRRVLQCRQPWGSEQVVPVGPDGQLDPLDQVQAGCPGRTAARRARDGHRGHRARPGRRGGARRADPPHRAPRHRAGRRQRWRRHVRPVPARCASRGGRAAAAQPHGPGAAVSRLRAGTRPPRSWRGDPGVVDCGVRRRSRTRPTTPPPRPTSPRLGQALHYGLTGPATSRASTSPPGACRPPCSAPSSAAPSRTA